MRLYMSTSLQQLRGESLKLKTKSAQILAKNYICLRLTNKPKTNMGGLALMVISPKIWEFLPFFMITLWIIQQHLKVEASHNVQKI